MARRVMPQRTNGSNGAHMKKGSRSPRTCCIAAGLLGARRERPRGCSAADERDEIATPHWKTSSAATSKPGGTVRPSALAVFRLMAVSNLVGC